MANKAMLFPGQGAQKVGMAADFVEKFSLAREYFDRADECLGYQLSKLVLDGPDEELTLTKYCQPAIYLTSIAIAEVLKAEGHSAVANIDCCAGLSLGEYSALYFAGVFSFEDGLKLVASRGAAMQLASDEPASGMVSLLGADLEKANAVAAAAAEGEVMVVANLLSPGQIVLSGSQSACARVPALAKELGVKRAIPLKVAGAFHSPLMAPAASTLTAELLKVEMSVPRIPVVTNASAEFMTDVNDIRAALEKQIVEPVLWQKSMELMIAEGVTQFVEPGPGKVLSGLIRKIDRSKECLSFETIADLG